MRVQLLRTMQLEGALEGAVQVCHRKNTSAAHYGQLLWVKVEYAKPSLRDFASINFMIPSHQFNLVIETPRPRLSSALPAGVPTLERLTTPAPFAFKRDEAAERLGVDLDGINTSYELYVHRGQPYLSPPKRRDVVIPRERIKW